MSVWHPDTVIKLVVYSMKRICPRSRLRVGRDVRLPTSAREASRTVTLFPTIGEHDYSGLFSALSKTYGRKVKGTLEPLRQALSELLPSSSGIVDLDFLSPEARFIFSLYCKCRRYLRIVVIPNESDWWFAADLGTLVATWNVTLQDKGLRNLGSWGGTVYGNLPDCIGQEAEIRVLFIETEDIDGFSSCIKEQVFPWSVVMADQRTSIIAAETLLNDNARELLQYSAAYSESDHLMQECAMRAEQLSKIMYEHFNPQERECIRIDSGFVMFAYGYRPTRDFDIYVMNPFGTRFAEKVSRVFSDRSIMKGLAVDVAMVGVRYLDECEEWLRAYPAFISAKGLDHLNFMPHYISFFKGIRLVTLRALLPERLDRVERWSVLGGLVDVLAIRMRLGESIPLPRINSFVSLRDGRRVSLGFDRLKDSIKQLFRQKYHFELSDSTVERLTQQVWKCRR